MAWLRRQRRIRRRMLPAIRIAATVAAALLVLSLRSYSILPPSLPRLQPPLVKLSSVLIKNRMELRSNAADAFRVPSGGGSPVKDLWGSGKSKGYCGCSNASSEFMTAEANTLPNRYLMIAASGGLNQQRTGITDAVVAARILNATLVVPMLDQASFWKDASEFADIFNVDWFIASLAKDVRIVKELPGNDGQGIQIPHSMRVPRKCSPKCYQSRVLPVLTKKHVVQLTKYDYRLSNDLDTDLQKLRCRVNYHGLRFTDQIQMMGDALVQRMKAISKHFIALHLRFEPDMLAFSGCYYGGGDKERTELGEIRKRWKTLRASDPEKERRHGKCPLTPEEVGLMLRALGFGKEVHLYVASGSTYGGEESLALLKALFPNFHTKETLTTEQELAPFSSYSSRMAALDFIVCDGSDVFVTNNNGNMARILAGRRRYFGHKRTIRPNAKKLHSLFANRTGMTWETFSSKVRAFQKGFMGEPNEARPGRGEFHENPSACICEASSNSYARSKFENGDAFGDYHLRNEGLDWMDLESGENMGKNGGSSSSNGTEQEEEHYFIRQEASDLEEIVSD